MVLPCTKGRPLAPLTTLGLGGPAAHFVEARQREDVLEALAWADERALPVGILGGGSNLVVGDAGFDGLVVQIKTSGVSIQREGDDAIVTSQAGERWDDLVERAVSDGLAGIECLTGIPGDVGATPIQNVGAYGQEVANVIEAVEVIDRQRGEVCWLTRDECAFDYRDSRFKRAPGKFVVLSVRFRLRVGGAPTVRYAELERAVADRGMDTDLRTVAETVRALRAKKGMLIAPGWEPSAGSFFTNPILSQPELAQVVARATAEGLIADPHGIPQYPLADGRVKLAAAFLIERSGITKGMRRGPVGVSRHHALSLVHHGGGSTSDLMALAIEIQQRVAQCFGVQLSIEPVRW